LAASAYFLPTLVLEACLVVSVSDEDSIMDIALREPGELCVRGATVMLNNPGAAVNSITANGWFKTGVIAVNDSGHVTDERDLRPQTPHLDFRDPVVTICSVCP
jgi:hypothetical protein